MIEDVDKLIIPVASPPKTGQDFVDEINFLGEKLWDFFIQQLQRYEGWNNYQMEQFINNFSISFSTHLIQKNYSNVIEGNKAKLKPSQRLEMIDGLTETFRKNLDKRIPRIKVEPKLKKVKKEKKKKK